MALADLNSLNGFAPIPGTVHRPTRSSLPPVQGCAPAPADYVPVIDPIVNGRLDIMGTSGLTHREEFRRMDDGGKYVAVVKLNTARGILPKPAAPAADVEPAADIPMTTQPPMTTEAPSA